MLQLTDAYQVTTNHPHDNEDSEDKLERFIDERERTEKTLIESMYNGGKWANFLKENVCDIAAINGWIYWNGVLKMEESAQKQHFQMLSDVIIFVPKTI